MTTFVATIAEAWQEVRVHRGRIILALSGVGLAVAILCSVFTLGQIASASTKAITEAQSGRAATILVQPPSGASSPAEVAATFAGIVDRYQVKYWSTELNSQVTFQYPDGTRPTQTYFVGVSKNQYQYDSTRAYMLQSQAEAAFPINQSQFASLRMWVPTEQANQLTEQMTAELASTGQMVQRADYLSTSDPFLPMQLSIAAIGVLVLLLGAVGLLNINLVTIKYRVAEIGVRRSFGATTGRIFVGIILESVVATFLAGVVGVVFVVLLYKSPLLPTLMQGSGIQLPPFPIEAAVVGVVSATVVGALAGLLPALYAVRAKVIDAIRV